MSTEDETPDVAVDSEVQEMEETRPELNLEINVEEKSACERHITVTIAREDVDRYFSEKVDELMTDAAVPGFRPGRAPRQLVENRFRKQLKDQVKGALLLDAMTQVTESDGFSAISEPDFDFEAVELPDEGSFTFEFDIEVRPDFDLPKWDGLELERPVREFSDDDVEAQLRQVLQNYADLVPHDGPAETGDFVIANITSKIDGKVVAELKEESLCVRPVLSFPDASIENFGELVEGAKAGDTKTTTVTISEEIDSQNAGKEAEVSIEILDVKRVDASDIDDESLEKLGGFESVDEVRKAIRQQLERNLNYEQNQKVRDQISSMLTESANWELPPELLRRQANRELERAVLELQASGFPQDAIRAYENELRRNSLKRTEQSLKEHFILERIAEDLEIEADDNDYNMEIAMIAAQQNDSVRRVRARIEKQGQMDALRNQIIERKVIGEITSKAKFKDVEFELPGNNQTAVDESLSGEATPQEIPAAKYDNDPESEQKAKS